MSDFTSFPVGCASHVQTFFLKLTGQAWFPWTGENVGQSVTRIGRRMGSDPSASAWYATLGPVHIG